LKLKQLEIDEDEDMDPANLRDEPGIETGMGN